jgi:ABC-2 type transport system permease protein
MKKNSSINAASLLSFWIILIIVLPALLNNFIINRYPLPEALDTVIEQREDIMQNGIQIKSNYGEVL